MRNFTLSFLSVLCLSAFTLSAKAQCPNVQMTATPLTFSGACYIFVQGALPNSNVSIYNANGFVAQAAASGSGQVGINFDCSLGPITGVLSLGTGQQAGQICDDVNISQPATLPVKFTGFSGKIVTGGVNLTWSIAWEVNNEKYVIEKSTDGRNYTAIGEIATPVNSLVDKSYTFKDEAFKSGDAAYYRIAQVDFDRRSTYTKVVYVNDSKSGLQNIKLFPNPFRADDAIQITGVRSSDVTRGNIRVFNVTGSAISYEITGSNAIQIDPKAPAGLYIVKILEKSYRILKN